MRSYIIFTLLLVYVAWSELVWTVYVWPDVACSGLVWTGVGWYGLVWVGVAWCVKQYSRLNLIKIIVDNYNVNVSKQI